MATFLVERYWPGVTETSAARAFVQTHVTAAEMAAEGVEIACLSSQLVLADEAVIALYEAPSESAIEELSRRADVPADRISRCVSLHPQREP